MHRLRHSKRLIGVMAASAVLLSGCFGSPKTTATGAKINPNEKVTLTMWGLFDDPAVFEPIIKQYHQQHPNVTVQYVKKDFADYELDSLDALAARTGPDIWMIRNDWIPEHLTRLVAAPPALFTSQGTTGLAGFSSQFPDVTVHDAVVDGKIYGVPLSVDTLVLYYNRAQFQAKRQELDRSDDAAAAQNDDLRQAPVSWADTIRVAKLLEQRTDKGAITRSGLALGAPNVDQSQDILAALMLQRSTQMVAADRKSASFNLPQTAASGRRTVPGNDALNFFRSFSDSTNPTFTWPSDFPNSVEAFEQGKVAMILNYGYLAANLKQQAPTLDFGIFPLPQIEGATTPVDYASYWLHTVTNSSKHPDVAWDFLASTLQDASSYQQATGRPGNSRPPSSTLPETVPDRAVRGSPLDFQRASAQNWYKGLRPLKVDGILRELIQATTNGDDAQHALDAAAQKVTALLQAQTPPPAPTPATPAAK